MRDQEIVGLYEAYQQVYSSQELTEEVEIASHYFYEMGLNEDGVNILIEDLGLEEFVEFVYDIAEEYVLTEARAGDVRIEPQLASGKAIVGKPKAASLKRLRAKKAERAAGESKASESKPSGMKASLQRQSAVAAAAKKQPEKPGLLRSVADAVSGGIDRHNAAMSGLKKMTAATKETVGKVRKAAGEFKKGFMGEEVENWVNALVEEGYDLSEYTWDDMYEMYVEEVERLDERRYDKDEPLPGSGETPSKKMQRARARHGARVMLGNPALGRSARSDPEKSSYFNRASTMDIVKKAQDAGEEPRDNPGFKNTIAARRRTRASYEVPNERPGGLRAKNTKAGGHRTLKRKEKEEESELQVVENRRMSRDPEGRNSGHSSQPDPSKPGFTGIGNMTPAQIAKMSAKIDKKKKPQDANESYDLFDYILEYLVAEGYADTNENAIVIMSNMGEEWRESIVDEAYQEPKFGKKEYIKKLSKRGGMGMGTQDDPHGYRDPKMAKVGAELSARKTAAAKAKKTGEPDTYRAGKEAQSKRG